MSDEEFNEWKIFHEIRPFGNEWTDFRFGVMTANICACLSSGGSRKFIDFMTPIAGRESPRQSPEAQANILDQLAGIKKRV